MNNTISVWRRYPELLSFKNNYKSINEESIVLVGTPLHKNLGDHLIAESERIFLKDTFPNAQIFEIPVDVFLKNFIFLKKHTPSNAKVFITGGGWMGDLWPEDELSMQKMIDTFSHCNVTILPQTIYYDNANNHTLLEDSKKAMKSCPGLKLCTRDKTSYDFAKKNLCADKLILAPDMSLYFRTAIDNSKTENGAAGICLRNDREKVASDNVDILKQLLKFQFDIREVNTIAAEPVAFKDRMSKIEEVLKTFASCPVIMTDRLQAMIFSVLVGTKCIALSNKTGKVAGIYKRWLNWNENIVLADADLDYAKMEMFICTPYKYMGYAKRLKPEFDKLKDFIRK